MFSALAAVGAAAVISHGAFHRNSPVFGRVLARLPRGAAPEIALTFDDGPNPVATPMILETLAREGVRATFFLLGRHVDRWPGIARDIADAGHEVANHGYHHQKLHLRGPAYARLDIALGAEAIERATGRMPRMFRAPHGFRSPWVTPVARSLGQRSVGWTLGVWDSDRPGAAEIARRAVRSATPGMIVLLHDGDGSDPQGDRTQPAEALPEIISGLRARGYSFVALPA